jgi:hypothetical protein
MHAAVVAQATGRQAVKAEQAAGERKRSLLQSTEAGKRGKDRQLFNMALYKHGLTKKSLLRTQ